jgi:hypothetical protein
LATLAGEHARVLEPLVPHLTVVAPSEDRDVLISLDGQRLEPSALGAPLPVDPGRHRVNATRAGSRPWSTDLTIEPGRDARVAIPALVAEPALAAAAPAMQREKGSVSPLAITLLGGSLVGAGVGTYFGLLAIRSHREAQQGCTTLSCDAARETNDAARTQAWVSTAAFAGAVLAGAWGGYVLYRDLRRPRPGGRVATVAAGPGAFLTGMTVPW